MRRLLILAVLLVACGETKMAETRPTYFGDFASAPVGTLSGGAAVTVRPPAATRIQGWDDGGFEPPVNQLNYQFDNYAKWDRWLAAANARAASYVVAASTGLVLETEYDALCDGAADQTEINAAITAVAFAGGGVVQLSEGTFTIDGTINGAASVELRMSHGTVIQVSAAVATSFNMITVDSVTNFWVTNGTLDGNSSAHALYHSGVYATIAQDCGSRRVRFVNMQQSAVGAYGHGVHIASGERYRSEFDFFDDCEGAAIMEASGVDDTAVIEPTVVDCGAAAHATDSGGIILAGDDPALLGGRIDACYVAGLSVRSARGSIVGPRIRDSIAIGLEVTGDDNEIANPMVYNSGTVGIKVLAGADDNKLMGGSSDTSATYGVHVLGDRLAIGGGFKANESGHHGIYLEEADEVTVNGIIVADSSQATHNTFSHIYVEGGDECSITNNKTIATDIGGFAPESCIEMDGTSKPTKLNISGNHFPDISRQTSTFITSGCVASTNYRTTPEWVGSGAAANNQDDPVYANYMR
jgi:hypothetical protein